MRQEIIAFIKNQRDCFERSLRIGHITGSAWIVDRNFQFALLTHHAKLNKWFQLGGHSDGNWNTLEVAIREAQEESGLQSLMFLHEDIFDVDVHLIPKRGDEPTHKHYDIRFVFSADKRESLQVTSESKDLAWVQLGKIPSLNPDPAILRMVEKSTKLDKK